MKEIKSEEREWKVEEAVHTLMKYQELIKDKKLKEEAIQKLKEKKESIDKTLKTLS